MELERMVPVLDVAQQRPGRGIGKGSKRENMQLESVGVHGEGHGRDPRFDRTRTTSRTRTRTVVWEGMGRGERRRRRRRRRRICLALLVVVSVRAASSTIGVDFGDHRFDRGGVKLEGYGAKLLFGGRAVRLECRRGGRRRGRRRRRGTRTTILTCRGWR